MFCAIRSLSAACRWARSWHSTTQPATLVTCQRLLCLHHPCGSTVGAFPGMANFSISSPKSGWRTCFRSPRGIPGASRISAFGRSSSPDLVLSAEACQVVGMVLHELVTNAAKHGALSTREGKVSVKWHRKSNGDARAGLVLEWRESGIPDAEPASKVGYGMSVISELIPHELGGKANHVLTPEGAHCQLEIPGHWLDATGPG